MTTTAHTRPELLRGALHLEYLTVGWNILEGIIAVAAALSSGSIALLGFGIDSFVESASAGVLIWRLQAEQRTDDPGTVARLDRQAHRLVGLSLFLLAAYVAADAGRALWHADAPRATFLGIAITSLSLGVMWWLARTKRRTAVQLKSRALHADSLQSTACWWLSLIVLTGIGLNAVFGWWWADPVAALGMTVFLVREGREAWRGEDCCD
jgi:divalent metal cation (Fe/Co/Zn/Cd) transporter